LLYLLPIAALAAAGLLPLKAQEPDRDNRVEMLRQKLERGEASLTYNDKGFGYLESVLKALEVPEESQVLAFSKSSFQFNLISPKTPRAIYFNDDVSVAAVQGGRVLELIVNDRKGGAAFYTIDTGRTEKPNFRLEGAHCTSCHGMVGGRAIGWMVANITTTVDGQPQFANPGRPFDFTDHSTPFERRWGGWYVTGLTGKMRHRGNVASSLESPYELSPSAGLNITSLSGKYDVSQTLKSSSDIVALMVLEHQTGFINKVGALNVTPTDDDLESLVAYMMFADETELPDPVHGNSGFAGKFAAMGPRDPRGRSLREFDLKTRLFRHPLSYMIYSDAFDSLKPQLKTRLLARLREELGKTSAGREAIAIAAATKPELGWP
jgi:hypothetical protein